MPPHAPFESTLRAGELNGTPPEPLLARCLSLSQNRPMLGSSAGTVARSLQCYSARLQTAWNLLYLCFRTHRVVDSVEIDPAYDFSR